MDINLSLGDDDIAMLIDALDCYEYSELGRDLPRNNGVVFLPGDYVGDQNPYWSAELTETEMESIAEIRRSRGLAQRLQVALQQR
jgi:hypothetical protein